MIDWQTTKVRFGYESKSEIVGLKRPLVICKCDRCGKSKEIAIRVKSRITSESESVNMFRNGYRRVWDAGHIKLVYNR